MSAELTISRIAIAVRNLDRARSLYEALFGQEFRPAESLPGVALLELDPGGGRPVIELVQPVDQENAIARFIRKQGEGIHHLSAKVKDLEAALSRLKAAGARIVRADSYYRAADGRRPSEAFVHPKDAHGVLFHLMEDG